MKKTEVELFDAIMEKSPSAFLKLITYLELGGDVNAQNEYDFRNTILTSTIKYQVYKLIFFLLKHKEELKLDVNKESVGQCTPLEMLLAGRTENPDGLAVLSLLLEAGAIVRQQDADYANSYLPQRISSLVIKYYRPTE
jgi:hypothetical protein